MAGAWYTSAAVGAAIHAVVGLFCLTSLGFGVQLGSSSSNEPSTERIALSDLAAITRDELDELVRSLLASDEALEPFAVEFEVHEEPAAGSETAPTAKPLVVASGTWGRWDRSFFATYTTRPPGDDGDTHLVSNGEILLSWSESGPEAAAPTSPRATISDRRYHPRVMTPGGVGSAGLGWLGQRWSLMLPAFARHHWLDTREIHGRSCFGVLCDQYPSASAQSLEGPILVWFDRETLLPMRLDWYLRRGGPSANPSAARSPFALHIDGDEYGRMDSYEVLASEVWKGTTELPTRIRVHQTVRRSSGDRTSAHGALRTQIVHLRAADGALTPEELRRKFAAEPPVGSTVWDTRSGASWVVTTDGDLPMREQERSLGGLLDVLRKATGQIAVPSDVQAALGAGGPDASATHCLWLAARLLGYDVTGESVQAAFPNVDSEEAASLRGLQAAALALGLEALYVEVDAAMLLAADSLAIVQVLHSDWATGFALVLPPQIDTADTYLIASPPTSWTRWSGEALAANTSGQALLLSAKSRVHPEPPPAVPTTPPRPWAALVGAAIAAAVAFAALWRLRRRPAGTNDTATEGSTQ